MYKKIILLMIILFLIPAIEVFSIDQKEIEGVPKVYRLLYKEETEICEIDACIPVIKGIENKVLQAEFNQLIRDEILDFTEDIKRQAEEFQKVADEEGFPFHPFQAVVKVDIKNRDDILSLVVKYYQYTGGAHGITSVVSYNLDTRTGKDLSLVEFLSRTTKKLEQIRGEIEKEIEENPNIYFPDAIEIVRNKDEFSYYISGGKIYIYFQNYEIAPYYVGIPEFGIKY